MRCTPAALDHVDYVDLTDLVWRCGLVWTTPFVRSSPSAVESPAWTVGPPVACVACLGVSGVYGHTASSRRACLS